MCLDCGCSSGDVNIIPHTHHHDHHGHNAHTHPHPHNRLSPSHTHAHGLTPARTVKIEQDILSQNNHYAQQNRTLFRERQIFVLNLVSSPGSGKTTLLTKTIELLKAELPISVIEGDQQTSHDAERIRATGVKAVQINTGKGCHLDAHGIGHAVEHLAAENGSILFIENVGNLVCPSAFDLGEAHKVVILSVTEGEDKPLKYPDMFHAADVMLLNKIDLLPHLDFDVAQCIEYARRVNPRIKVLQVSAKTGEGLEHWLQWLKTGRELALIG
jgi:hydrogenase nickel incorporation protein HypB